MKPVPIVVILVCLSILIPAIGFAQGEEKAPEKVLVGPLELTDLLDLPGWFGPDYLKYTPNPSYTKRLPEYMKGMEVLCFLGTWCDDSPREVCRLIKIMQGLTIGPEQIKFYGLDRKKQSPQKEELKYNIQKVPTFVFMKNGMEAGRIVEAPIGLLEKDILGLFIPPEPEQQQMPVDTSAAAGRARIPIQPSTLAPGPDNRPPHPIGPLLVPAGKPDSLVPPPLPTDLPPR